MAFTIMGSQHDTAMCLVTLKQFAFDVCCYVHDTAWLRGATLGKPIGTPKLASVRSSKQRRRVCNAVDMLTCIHLPPGLGQKDAGASGDAAEVILIHDRAGETCICRRPSCYMALSEARMEGLWEWQTFPHH